MNNPKTLSQDAIAEAAAVWFAKLDSGSADLATFEAWRADPRHAAAFARIAATDIALDRVDGLALQDDPDLRATPRLSRRDLFTAAAVVVATLVGGGIWFTSVSRATASTPVGGRKTVALPDGGSMDLNTDTRASWRFDHTDRRIWLEHGEANIVVPPDHRPCSIYAGDTAVVFTGGSVNARLQNRALAVSVLKGDCSVGPKGAPDAQVTRVASNEAAVSTGGVTRVHAMTEDDIQAVSAWQKDELIFNGETLGAAVDEYNRYLTNKMEIADPALSGIRLGGRFKTNDPQGFLVALHSSFSIQINRDSDGTVILSR